MDPSGQFTLVELVAVTMVVAIAAVLYIGISSHIVQRDLNNSVVNLSKAELKSVPFGRKLWRAFESFNLRSDPYTFGITDDTPYTSDLTSTIYLNRMGFGTSWPYPNERPSRLEYGVVLAHEIGHVLQDDVYESFNHDYVQDFNDVKWERLDTDLGGETSEFYDRKEKEIDAVRTYENRFRIEAGIEERRSYHGHPLH